METQRNSKLVRVPKLAEQIAQLIAGDIKRGILRIGEKLPSELELCEQFAVSRTVVREAIGRLEYDGFVEAKRGARATVADSGSRRVFRIDRSNSMELYEMTQLYELRLIIEGAAVALAATRAKKANIKKLEKHIHNMEEADRTDRDGTPSNVQFHQLIAESSGNTYLRDFMTFINDKVSYLSLLDEKQLKKQGSQQIVQKEHHAICLAIKDKDSTLARKLIQAHIRNAAKRQGITLDPIWND